jgi:hypothetical protein
MGIIGIRSGTLLGVRRATSIGLIIRFILSYGDYGGGLLAGFGEVAYCGERGLCGDMAEAVLFTRFIVVCAHSDERGCQDGTVSG